MARDRTNPPVALRLMTVFRTAVSHRAELGSSSSIITGKELAAVTEQFMTISSSVPIRGDPTKARPLPPATPVWREVWQNLSVPRSAQGPCGRPPV